MNWIFALKNPYKAAVILAVVMLSVIIFDLIHRKNISDMNRSMVSIYNDRLVPASEIFHATELMHERRLMMHEYLSGNAPTNPMLRLTIIDAELNGIIARYEKTYLVKNEKKLLADLKNEISAYRLHEKTSLELFAEAPQLALNRFKTAALPSWQTSVKQFSELVHIQAQVGNQLLNSSENIHLLSGFLSMLHIVLAIVLGVMVIALAKHSKMVQSTQQNYRLN